MVATLFGPSGSGKTSILREIEHHDRFRGEVFPSPIRGIIRAGLLPDPTSGDLEANMFQMGLSSILFEMYERIARVYKNRDDWALVDRSYLDTLPYWAARLGYAHPLQDELLDRFFANTTVAIYVPPFPGSTPSEYAKETKDRELFDQLYSYLKFRRDENVRMLTSTSLEDRIEEVLSILEEADASLSGNHKRGRD